MTSESRIPSWRQQLRRVLPKTREWCHESFDLPSDSRIRSIEGLRGAAVLLVFLVHYDALFAAFAPRESLTYQVSRFAGAVGNVGVDVFFVISGYLIYGGVLRKNTRVVNFLKRRVQRIYPTFLCALTLYLAGELAFPEFDKIAWRLPAVLCYVLENVLLLPGIVPITPIISVAWSLSYEFFFYLTLPILVVSLGIRGWTRSVRVIFFAGLVLLHILLSIAGVISLLRFSMFAAGIFLFEALESGVFEGRLCRAGEIATIIPFCVALGVAGLILTAPATLTSSGARSCWLPVFKLAVLFIATFALMLYSFRFDGLLKRLFDVTSIRRMGNISYSYYLIHAGSLHAFQILLRSMWPNAAKSVIRFWILLPTGLVITVVPSAVVFLVVEKRFSLRPSPASQSTANRIDYPGMSAVAD